MGKIKRGLIRSVAILFVTSFLSFSSYGQNTQNWKSAKDIAISYIIEVVNNRKLTLIQEIYSADYVFHGMVGAEMHTIKDSSLFYFLTNLFKAFPDLHYSIDNAIAEGDMVALSLTGRATHKAEFLGYPASNKKIQFKEMFFFKIQNGKISEGWGVVDIDGVKRQISN
jgi:steroid delta-isomerase-like uncharacterized protein